MAKLRLSKAAQDDLVGIRLFSNMEFGAGTTDSYMRGFNNAFRRLRDFPRWGAPVEEFGEDLRCITHRSHRIFYRVESSEVVVIRIIHHARDMKRSLIQ